MSEEVNLKYKIVKADSDHSSITIPNVKETDIVHKFVIQDNNLFQRFRVFNNGLIVCEEISNGRRIFRSNKPL